MATFRPWGLYLFSCNNMLYIVTQSLNSLHFFFIISFPHNCLVFSRVMSPSWRTNCNASVCNPSITSSCIHPCQYLSEERGHLLLNLSRYLKLIKETQRSLFSELNVREIPNYNLMILVKCMVWHVITFQYLWKLFCQCCLSVHSSKDLHLLIFPNFS